MKVEKVIELVGYSKPTIYEKVKSLNIDVETTETNRNIFRWKDIVKLKYNKLYGTARHSPIVLSICQNKGGVGKTTSVINLATALSYIGKTLMIDLDGQANLSESFNLDYDYTLTDIISDNSIILDSVVNVSPSLDLIPNNIKFDRWKKRRKVEDTDQFILRGLINSLKNDYQFIIIDTPPSLDISLEMAFFASDYCIIPFQPQDFGIGGVANIHEEIEILKSEDKTNSLNLKVLGMFVTLNEKVNLSQQINQAMIKKYNVFETMISKTVSLPESQTMTQSIFDYNEASPASTDYYNLTFEILERILK